VRVSLPSTQLLTKVDPNDLIAMRVELGGEYLAAIRTWQAAPNEANMVNVQNTLRFYCDEISARYKNIAPVRRAKCLACAAHEAAVGM
jgi:hypothetical protein